MEKEILKKETKKLNKFQIYTLYLFIFSILGWCMETLYAFILSGHFVNRGFLYGPLCPIYGFGALILIIFLEKIVSNFFFKNGYIYPIKIIAIIPQAKV